jgi:hypothetical protein
MKQMSVGVVCLDTLELLLKYSSRKLIILGIIIDDCVSSHQSYVLIDLYPYVGDNAVILNAVEGFVIV